MQKDVIATDSNYDPTENVLSVEDDVDGILKYTEGKGNVAGKYTIERRNANDHGYTAVVNATDKAGNTATKKFSVVYDDLIDDVIKGSTLNPTDTDGIENSNHNSVAPSNEADSTIKESTANYNSGPSQETSNQAPALIEEKKKQLDTPYVRSDISDGLLVGQQLIMQITTWFHLMAVPQKRLKSQILLTKLMSWVAEDRAIIR